MPWSYFRQVMPIQHANCYAQCKPMQRALALQMPFLFLESPVIHDDVFHGHLVGSLTGDLTSTGLWRPAAPTNLALTSITIQRKHVVVVRWRLGVGRNHKMIGVFRVRQQIRSRGIIWRWRFGRGCNRSIVHQMLMVIGGQVWSIIQLSCFVTRR